MAEDARKQLTREQRESGVAESFASIRLQGQSATPAGRRDAEDYIGGRRDLDETVADVLARHSRGPRCSAHGLALEAVNDG